MKIRKRLILLASRSVVLMLVYLAAFMWLFEIFGSPVRDDTHGWLGPAIRGDSHIMDMGKVYYYEGTNFSAYRTFRPCCRVWLPVMGF